MFSLLNVYIYIYIYKRPASGEYSKGDPPMATNRLLWLRPLAADNTTTTINNNDDNDSNSNTHNHNNTTTNNTLQPLSNSAGPRGLSDRLLLVLALL